MYELLESLGCVPKPNGISRNSETERCCYSSGGNVFGCYRNLVVGLYKIDLRKHTHPRQVLSEILKVRKQVLIRHIDGTQCSVFSTRSQITRVLLGHDMQQGGPNCSKDGQMIPNFSTCSNSLLEIASCSPESYRGRAKTGGTIVSI